MIAAGLLWPIWWPAVLAIAVAWPVAGQALRRRRTRCPAPLGRRTDALAGRPVHRRLQAMLSAVALALLLVALLQPVWGRARGEVVGADVVLCLDVSLSMAARDVPPSRFGRAEAEIDALAVAAAGARLGLVAFGGSARLLVPLCSDGAAVAQVAATLAPGLVRGGTDLGAAIDLASAMLQRTAATAPAIVLLTDGEDFGDSGSTAAARARQAGIAVHCVGFGSAAGSKVVVEGDGGEVFLRDQNGVEVESRVDTAGLAAIAAAGGGRSLVVDGSPVAGPNGAAAASALAALYAATLAPAAEASALATGDPRLSPAHRYGWFVLAAFLVWFAATLLPQRRR